MATAQDPSPSPRFLFKGIFQGTGLYAIPLLGQNLASIAVLPIISRVLTTADYGVANLLEKISSVLTIILGGNFASALGYFYFKKASAPDRNAVVGTVLIGALLIGSLAGLICWPLTAALSALVPGDPSVKYYLRVIFLSMPLAFLLEALLSWLRVADRRGTFVAGSLLRIGVTIVGIVVLVGLLKLHVWGVLLTAVIAIVVAALVLGVYCLGAMPPSFRPRLFVEIARFAVPLSLSGLAMFVLHFGDQFILARYRPLAEVGIYALAYKIGMLVSVAGASFQSYWNAQVFQIMRRDDADIVFARLFTYVVLGLAFVGLGLTVCSRPALWILTRPSYRGAAPLIPVIAIAYFLRSVGDFFRCLFLVEGRPSLDAACTWLGTIVCVGGYFTLIPPYGMWGAAIASVVAFALIAVVSIVWTYRLRPYRLETSRLGKVAVALAAILLPHGVVRVASLPWQIGWSALLLSAFPFILWLLRFPTPGEREMMGTALRSLRRRKI
ncbi:MAG: oligosaccharide flippase family protein [Acidobacteriia bacterium]|nr:oligosaccharide flippase family protein [Terriglobia bacterium]